MIKYLDTIDICGIKKKFEPIDCIVTICGIENKKKVFESENLLWG